MHKLQPSEKKSHSGTFILIAVALAWLALLFFGYFELFGSHGPAHQIRGAGKVEQKVADIEAGSLGGEREALLVAATKQYVEEHSDAPAAMAGGEELAPADYLNEYLSEHEAHFRVREVHGKRAEMYDVS